MAEFNFANRLLKQIKREIANFQNSRSHKSKGKSWNLKLNFISPPRLILHDFVEEGNSRCDGNVFDGIAFGLSGWRSRWRFAYVQILNGVVVMSPLFVRMMMNSLEMFKLLIDLASCRTNRLAAAGFELTQELVVVLDVWEPRLLELTTTRLGTTRLRTWTRCRWQAWRIAIFALLWLFICAAGYWPKFQLPWADWIAIVRKADTFGEVFLLEFAGRMWVGGSRTCATSFLLETRQLLLFFL